MAFTIITGGSFTSTGAAVRLNMPSTPDYFKTWNITQLAATNPNTVVHGEWFGSKFGVGQSADGSGIKTVKTTGMLESAFAAATGFYFVSTSPNVGPQSANAITAITAADPAVVSQTNTYSDGDILQFYGTTGMLQIGGMNFEISSSSGSGYTLIGLRAAGFAAPGTAGYTRRISPTLAVDPQYMYITEITQATQAVVRTSVNPARYYVVGMKIHFSVPYSYGMTQINGLTGTITAISAANYTVTVDIDSSAFTAFAFPASSASPTATLFATFAPAGASTKIDLNTGVTTGYDFQFQPFHTGQFTPFMYLVGGAQSPAGAANDIVNWMAYKLEN